MHRPNISCLSGFLRRVATVLAALILVTATSGYEYPLSDTAIREAYFFGTSADREKVEEFLGQYARHFTPASAGAGVNEIELRTPYERVVQISSENRTLGYSAQQAQIDESKRRDYLDLRVTVFIGRNYTESDKLYTDTQGKVRDRREDFWRQFKLTVLQDRPIELIKIEGEPYYDTRGRGLQGAVITAELSAELLCARNTTVQVTAPDGRTVAAEFHLDLLK